MTFTEPSPGLGHIPVSTGYDGFAPPAADETICARNGRAHIAGTASTSNIGCDQYVSVQCIRSQMGGHYGRSRPSENDAAQWP